MNPEDAVDLGREALRTCLFVGGPILAAGLLIGLVVGIAQAMTQVQDQTVSFVPKILLMLVAIGLALPWLSERMVEYTRESFTNPVISLSGTGGHVATPLTEVPIPVEEPAPQGDVLANDWQPSEAELDEIDEIANESAQSYSMPVYGTQGFSSSMPNLVNDQRSSMPVMRLQNRTRSAQKSSNGMRR